MGDVPGTVRRAAGPGPGRDAGESTDWLELASEEECLEFARQIGVIGHAQGLAPDLSTNVTHFDGFGETGADSSANRSTAPDPVAVARFDLRTLALDAFGLFPSLAQFSKALDAECRARGHRPIDPAAVNADGLGTVRAADESDGDEPVIEYHLVANTGRHCARDQGLAIFGVPDGEDGLPRTVTPCTVFVSEAAIWEAEEFKVPPRLLRKYTVSPSKRPRSTLNVLVL